MTLFYAIILGFLLGSIPFGLLLTRAAGLGDIRGIGSGNIGATNVLRTGNKKLAAATLLLDGVKGVAAVLLARAFWGEEAAALAALFAVIGHVAPPWLGFRGGKGVATALGVTLALNLWAGLICCLLWLVGAKLSRISSVGAMLAIIGAPFTLWALQGREAALAGLVLAVIVVFRHSANISRLLAGTEPRIGKGGQPRTAEGPEATR